MFPAVFVKTKTETSWHLQPYLWQPKQLLSQPHCFPNPNQVFFCQSTVYSGVFFGRLLTFKLFNLKFGKKLFLQICTRQIKKRVTFLSWVDNFFMSVRFDASCVLPPPFIKSVTSSQTADIPGVFLLQTVMRSQWIRHSLDAFSSRKLNEQFAVAPQCSVKFKCEMFCVSVCVCVFVRALLGVRHLHKSQRERVSTHTCVRVHIRLCIVCVCVCLGIRVVWPLKCVAGLISRNYTQIAFPRQLLLSSAERWIL